MVQATSESTETQCDHLVWQDIATAPTDGTEILLWDGMISIGSWWQNSSGSGYWAIDGGNSSIHHASFWMPLPKPPVMEVK